MKKIFTTLVAVFAIAHFSYAQWTSSGSDIHNTNSGSVGIGTTTPGALLDVNGALKLGGGGDYNTFIKFNVTDASFSPNYIQGNGYLNLSTNAYSSGGAYSISNTSNASWIVSMGACASCGGLKDNFTILRAPATTGSPSFAPLFTINSAGSFGIGITSPAFSLDVGGKIGINGGQVAYLPNQTDFLGTLVIGNGGGALTHTTGADGFQNTFVGLNTGTANTTGFRNTTLGYSNFVSNTTGVDNVAIGIQALASNTTGTSNLAAGTQALQANTTGNYNVGIGQYALYANTTGTQNTAVGMYSLRGVTTGIFNTAMGWVALGGISTGSNNTAIGNQAGNYIADGSTQNTTGSNSVFLGTNTEALADGDTNEIVIGYNAVGLGSNTVVLGNSSVTKTGLKGNVGIGTTTPNNNLEIRRDASGGGPELGITNANSTAGNRATIRFQNTAGGNTCAEISSIFQDHTTGRSDLIFSTHSGGGFSENMRILGNGKVGIGTTNPDEKLTVKGKIHSEEVRVDLSVPGPDYVFENDYKLPALNYLKSYVGKNHHLPEIPSAKEMAKDGLKLGEMNTLLLKKVEELTLYLIEKDQQISSLQSEVVDLKTAIKAINKALSKNKQHK